MISTKLHENETTWNYMNEFIVMKFGHIPNYIALSQMFSDYLSLKYVLLKWHVIPKKCIYDSISSNMWR